ATSQGAAFIRSLIADEREGRPCRPSPPLPAASPRRRPIHTPPPPRLRLHRPLRRPLHRPRPPLHRLQRRRRDRNRTAPAPSPHPHSITRSRAPLRTPRRRGLRTALHCATLRLSPAQHRRRTAHPHRRDPPRRPQPRAHDRHLPRRHPHGPRPRRLGAPEIIQSVPPQSQTHLTFPATWSAEILSTPPLIAPARQFTWPQQVPGEEDTLARGAMLPHVRRASGGAFLATCALGFRDASAVAGGYAYLANTLAPERPLHIPLRPVSQVLPAPEHNLLLLAGFHTIAAIAPSGLLWETARLTWDGLTLTGIRDNQLHGLGWDMRTDRELPFTVDLATGRHTGGAFS